MSTAVKIVRELRDTSFQKISEKPFPELLQIPVTGFLNETGNNLTIES